MQIDPRDLIIAFQNDLTPQMIDHIYMIDRRRPKDQDLITAIREYIVTEAEDRSGQVHQMVIQALQRRMNRFDRLPFVKIGAKDAFSQMVSFIKEGKSVVLDFGDFGTDPMVYLFVANVLSRRLFDLYTEHPNEYPRLVLFLEEAHKFLDPRIAEYSIFSRLARETRKFNLILALIDQRPSRIDDEVRSQLANRLVMSLKEPSDVESALAGVPDKGMWVNIVAKLPLRTVAVLGDAIPIPTVIDVIEYDDLKIRQHLLPEGAVDEGEMQDLAKRADDVFGRG
jgi:DNA helicase HerA-like ATPase